MHGVRVRGTRLAKRQAIAAAASGVALLLLLPGCAKTTANESESDSPKFAAGTFDTAPVEPQAGALFTVSELTLVLANGRRVAPSEFSCTAEVTRGMLKPLGDIAFGRCAWIIPGNARGQRLVVAVTATYRGQTKRLKPRTFTVR